nr:6-phosphofructokinase [bacterium]
MNNDRTTVNHMKPTVLVAQSGGPSPVINASLQGVVDACCAFPERCGRVLAAWHGVEGILQEELLDLSQESPEELHRLKHTPCAGAIGTCRYKLGAHQEQDFNRIIDVLRAHNVGWFFYIGGNDSRTPDIPFATSLIIWAS